MAINTLHLSITESVPPFNRFSWPRCGENPRGSWRRCMESLLWRCGTGNCGWVCNALWDRVNLPGHDVSLRHHSGHKHRLLTSVSTCPYACDLFILSLPRPVFLPFSSRTKVPLRAFVVPHWPPNERKSIINGLRRDLSPWNVMHHTDAC